MIITVMLAPLAGILAPAAQSARATAHMAAAEPQVHQNAAMTKTAGAPKTPATWRGKTWIVHDPKAYAAAAKSRNWVKTPEGLVYKSCVYQVPPGAIVDRGVI